MNNPHPDRHRSGFTLLEVMIALLLMGAISGMVFAIAHTSLNLGQGIIRSQGEAMEQQAFFELLGRRFSTLPGNARMELTAEPSGDVYLSDLTLQEVPMSFTWGGSELTAKAIRISTVKRRSGLIDVVLRYYEDEIMEGSATDFGSTATEPEPFAEIVLLKDLAYFEWRALNSSTMEWQGDWDQGAGGLPIQLELSMAIGFDGKPMRHVFWLPPKLDPQVVMRQLGSDSQTPVNPEALDNHGGGVTIEVGSPRQTEGGVR